MVGTCWLRILVMKRILIWKRSIPACASIILLLGQSLLNKKKNDAPPQNQEIIVSLSNRIRD